MNRTERIFKLTLSEETKTVSAVESLPVAMRGELWDGADRVPVAGVLAYRGRADAVITFFVDQFLLDDVFQPGDTLVLGPQKDKGSTVVLARRVDSARFE